MKSVSIIAAIAENNAIGKDNQLLWHLPEDLKRFKRITEGHPIIMGKHTYYSLPKRPLPGRTNIVLTTSPCEKIDGCQVVYSIDDAMNQCSDTQENFIIGGGSVYRQFFSHAQKLYITHVHVTLNADTFFPDIDPLHWKIIEKEEHKADEKNKYDYTFITYQRILLDSIQ
jgi:dihydrofolate reductase